MYMVSFIFFKIILLFPNLLNIFLYGITQTKEVVRKYIYIYKSDEDCEQAKATFKEVRRNYYRKGNSKSGKTYL